MSKCFTIYPNTASAVVAVAGIQLSCSKRPYNHWIKPMGKYVNNRVVLAYIDITTDPHKAEEGGFFHPNEWLQAQYRSTTNAFRGTR